MCHNCTNPHCARNGCREAITEIERRIELSSIKAEPVARLPAAVTALEMFACLTGPELASTVHLLELGIRAWEKEVQRHSSHVVRQRIEEKRLATLRLLHDMFTQRIEEI